MSRRINPVTDILERYKRLTEVERQVFQGVLKHIELAAAPAAQEQPRRGRPPGVGKAKATPVAPPLVPAV